jgi:hypothetical protein
MKEGVSILIADGGTMLGLAMVFCDEWQVASAKWDALWQDQEAL